MPYRKNRDGSPLPDWKENLNAQHRRIRAGVEHALARLKTWKILRDYRRAASTLTDTASGIAHLHHLLAGGDVDPAGRHSGTTSTWPGNS
jgi:hypothetical protein